jgi:hypothetical protein
LRLEKALRLRKTGKSASEIRGFYAILPQANATRNKQLLIMFFWKRFLCQSAMAFVCFLPDLITSISWKHAATKAADKGKGFPPYQLLRRTEFHSVLR